MGRPLGSKNAPTPQERAVEILEKGTCSAPKDSGWQQMARAVKGELGVTLQASVLTKLTALAYPDGGGSGKGGDGGGPRIVVYFRGAVARPKPGQPGLSGKSDVEAWLEGAKKRG